MKPYPIELRIRVLKARDDGFTQVEVAGLFDVTVRWIQYLERQQREEGSVQPRPHGGGRKRTVSEQDEVKIAEFLRDQPDATIPEIQEACGLQTSSSSVSRALARMGYSRKRKTIRYSEQERPDVAAERKAFVSVIDSFDAKNLVFLDESNAKTNMTRLYGRSPIGQRVFDSVPDGRYQSVTVLSALTLEGVGPSLVYEGGTDIGVMLSYVQQVLAPSLSNDSIVLMDNLSSHKNHQVTEAIEATGASVKFLPRYSPEFNPIEEMWSKVKSMLRSFKERTKEGLYDAIGVALEAVTPTDALGWFAHAGYNTNT